MLDRSVAVSNGKGGAGKTTVAAHLAGVAAAGGWRVLLVDLDPQGNLGQDLGYLQEGRSDGGRGLHAAVLTGSPLTPLAGIRPGLDVVPAGDMTEELIEVLGRRQSKNRGAVRDLEVALRPLAHDYELVVFDCPPGDKVMLDAALTAAHYVLIPTRADDGSLRGLERVAGRFSALRAEENPSLELLGVVLFDFGAGDRRIIAETRAELSEALGEAAPVFDTVVRHARKAARDMRRAGLLAFEYEKAAAAEPWYKRVWGSEGPSPTFAGNADDLAGDYQALGAEILRRFSERVATEVSAQ